MASKEQGTSFEAVVFKDAAGEYYLLPREVLERAKVPAERKAELERLAPELVDDVSGYATSTGVKLTPNQAIYWGHLLVVSGATDQGLQMIQAGFQQASQGVTGPTIGHR